MHRFNPVKRSKAVQITVTATLYLEPEDFQLIDQLSLSELEGKHFKSEEYGTIINFGGLNGTLYFDVPTLAELKAARLQQLNKTLD